MPKSKPPKAKREKRLRDWCPYFGTFGSLLKDSSVMSKSEDCLDCVHYDHGTCPYIAYEDEDA